MDRQLEKKREENSMIIHNFFLFFVFELPNHGYNGTLWAVSCYALGTSFRCKIPQYACVPAHIEGTYNCKSKERIVHFAGYSNPYL